MNKYKQIYSLIFISSIHEFAFKPSKYCFSYIGFSYNSASHACDIFGVHDPTDPLSGQPNTQIYLVSSYDCVQSSQCSGDLFCYYFKCVQASYKSNNPIIYPNIFRRRSCARRAAVWSLTRTTPAQTSTSRVT